MGKPRAERQQEIIEAAMQLAAEKGAKDVTTQAIADRVCIAQPTVFRHFKTRDAIFSATIDFIAANLFKALEVFFTGTGPADERLHNLIVKQLSIISKNKGLPRLLFSDRLHLESPALKAAVQKVMSRYSGQVAALIKEGQASGCFNAQLDADESASLIMAMVQGLLMRWSVFDFEFSLELEAEPLWCFIEAALKRP